MTIACVEHQTMLEEMVEGEDLSERLKRGAIPIDEAIAGFYATPGLGLNEVRIAYVLNCDDLRRAIHVLGEGLKAYAQRASPVLATA